MTATALLVTGWCAAMLPTCKAQGVVNDFNERMNRPETIWIILAFVVLISVCCCLTCVVQRRSRLQGAEAYNIHGAMGERLKHFRVEYPVRTDPVLPPAEDDEDPTPTLSLLKFPPTHPGKGTHDIVGEPVHRELTFNTAAVTTYQALKAINPPELQRGFSSYYEVIIGELDDVEYVTPGDASATGGPSGDVGANGDGSKPGWAAAGTTTNHEAGAAALAAGAPDSGAAGAGSAVGGDSKVMPVSAPTSPPPRHQSATAAGPGAAGAIVDSTDLEEEVDDLDAAAVMRAAASGAGAPDRERRRSKAHALGLHEGAKYAFAAPDDGGADGDSDGDAHVTDAELGGSLDEVRPVIHGRVSVGWAAQYYPPFAHVGVEEVSLAVHSNGLLITSDNSDGLGGVHGREVKIFPDGFGPGDVVGAGFERVKVTEADREGERRSNAFIPAPAAAQQAQKRRGAVMARSPAPGGVAEGPVEAPGAGRRSKVTATTTAGDYIIFFFTLNGARVDVPHGDATFSLEKIKLAKVLGGHDRSDAKLDILAQGSAVPAIGVQGAGSVNFVSSPEEHLFKDVAIEVVQKRQHVVPDEGGDVTIPVVAHGSADDPDRDAVRAPARKVARVRPPPPVLLFVRRVCACLLAAIAALKTVLVQWSQSTEQRAEAKQHKIDTAPKVIDIGAVDADDDDSDDDNGLEATTLQRGESDSVRPFAGSPTGAGNSTRAAQAKLNEPKKRARPDITYSPYLAKRRSDTHTPATEFARRYVSTAGTRPDGSEWYEAHIDDRDTLNGVPLTKHDAPAYKRGPRRSYAGHEAAREASADDEEKVLSLGSALSGAERRRSEAAGGAYSRYSGAGGDVILGPRKVGVGPDGRPRKLAGGSIPAPSRGARKSRRSGARSGGRKRSSTDAAPVHRRGSSAAAKRGATARVKAILDAAVSDSDDASDSGYARRSGRRSLT